MIKATKYEMVQEIQRLVKVLRMDADQFSQYIEKEIGHPVDADDMYCYRTGHVLASLEWLIRED